MVDVPDVVGGGLKVAAGVVALGDEDVVLGTILKRLVDGNRGTLEIVSVYLSISTQVTYHELLLDPAEALDARRQLEVVVRRGLGDGGDDGDPVPLGADVVGGGDAGDVDVCCR